MIWRLGLAACLGAMASHPVLACTIAPPPPPLAGETDAAYRARTAALRREQEASWLKERQADGLRQAARIFIAREVDWVPPSRAKYRKGRAILPPLAPVPFPPPSYFKPVAWLRGTATRRTFKVNREMTSCGPMSIGDTTPGTIGKSYVFFAHKGQLSEKTLIDAIAMDRISDLVLVELARKFHAQSQSTLP